jgi:hypothetical protein
MEPFQIFLLRKRSEVAAQNPDLTNSELTSLLGRMWRSLPQNEKIEYLHLAFSVTENQSPSRKRRRKSKPKPPPEQPLPVTPPVEETTKTEDFPQFSIIPRGSSGTQAAEASYHVIFPGQQPPDWSV